MNIDAIHRVARAIAEEKQPQVSSPARKRSWFRQGGWFALVGAIACAGEPTLDDQNVGDGPEGGVVIKDAQASADAEHAQSPDAGNRADSGARDAASGVDGRVAPDASIGGEPADAGPAGGAGPSTGCKRSVADRTGDFTKHTLTVGGRERVFYVYLPRNYDRNKPYPVVYRFHGATGDGLSGGLDIQGVAPADVIVVGPDGLNKTWSRGEEDVAFFDALVAAVEESYCVDQDRRFAYGFSAGAGFTEMLSCIRGDVLRGIAAVEGYDWGRGKTCVGTVAAWLLHDSSDQPAPIAGGIAARDRLLQQNGCSAETMEHEENCVEYRGCAPGSPVVWCETAGRGHDIRGDYAPEKVWEFFSGLP